MKKKHTLSQPHESNLEWRTHTTKPSHNHNDTETQRPNETMGNATVLCTRCVCVCRCTHTLTQHPKTQAHMHTEPKHKKKSKKTTTTTVLVWYSWTRKSTIQPKSSRCVYGCVRACTVNTTEKRRNSTHSCTHTNMINTYSSLHIRTHPHQVYNPNHTRKSFWKITKKSKNQMKWIWKRKERFCC